MLFEGMTIEATLQKALGKPINKNRQRPSRYGKPLPYSGKPFGGSAKPPGSPRKQAEANPHATTEAIRAARRNAVNRAKAMIASADVSVGARETGFAILYNMITGQMRVLREPEVGSGGLDDFEFNFAHSRNEIVMVTAHSHPKASRAGGPVAQCEAERLDRRNESISGNRMDQRLQDRAPVVIKTPSGRVLDFWRPGGYE